jgi:hypothetical protein
MSHSKTLLFVSLLLAFTSMLAAQDISRADFRKQWRQGISLEDDKILDKAMRRGSLHAILLYEEYWMQARSGDNANAELMSEALMASWGRCFENTETLEKVQRWSDGVTDAVYTRLQKVRSNSAKIWNDYQTNVAIGTNKSDYLSCFEDFTTLARTAESVGHFQEAADLWGLASVIGSKTPEKTIEDRENVVYSIEQQIACRDRWGYTFDTHYARNNQFIKSETASIEEAKKSADKRKSEGYSDNTKGVDALIMPGAVAKKFALKFSPLKSWLKDLDYGPRGGPSPPYWWRDSLGETGTSRKMGWFRQRDMYLLRRGANKFAVNWGAEDSDTAVAIDAGSRAKPTTFYLGSDKSLPYAMFFWIGTDQETTGMAKCNYSATDKLANIYYRSASSWVTQVGSEQLVFYDDDASGKPGDGEPFVGELKSHIVGDPAGSGAVVPLFDSMKIGKGKRVPYSEFVKLANGWHYMEIASGADVALRPLNPEYLKTGKVKLSWSGPKSTAPVQLVIQGKGDYATAVFDIGRGAPVEVPAGEYSVIWGRIVKGKGARSQIAQIYPTKDTESFLVKPGETHVLKMGGPFRLDFEREGDRNASVNALSICVLESSGCKLTGMQGISLACDLMASKNENGKGAKEVGEFVPFTNDQLILAAANFYNNLGFMAACFPMPKGYREGDMVLSVKLASEGMKLGLFVKKHKFFGKLETVWK